jgi:hypothetical protein
MTENPDEPDWSQHEVRQAALDRVAEWGRRAHLDFRDRTERARSFRFAVRAQFLTGATAEVSNSYL